MKVSEQFNSGKYLKAADVPRPVIATVTALRQEAMPDGELKWVVMFKEIRSLVLNKTNANAMSEFLGDDSDAWVGRRVELFAASTFMSGKSVPCIRVRQPRRPPQPAQQPRRDTSEPRRDTSAPQPPTPQQPQPPVVPPPPNGVESWCDEQFEDGGPF
ncbi:MAG: hypothetical protein KDB23_18565 [Planctomycetales bacterium]|nr:hypothetical protein [Planctomycetales bacterium]